MLSISEALALLKRGETITYKDGDWDISPCPGHMEGSKCPESLGELLSCYLDRPVSDAWYP